MIFDNKQGNYVAHKKIAVKNNADTFLCVSVYVKVLQN